jgi:hypothetical protein
MLGFAIRLGNRKRFSASQSWFRHQKAEVFIDPALPQGLWSLSAVGYRQFQRSFPIVD